MQFQFGHRTRAQSLNAYIGIEPVFLITSDIIVVAIFDLTGKEVRNKHS